VLLREGPAGLLAWEWVAIPLLLAVGVAAGAVLGWLTRKALGHLTARTSAGWDDALLDRIAAPLTALFTVGVVAALHSFAVFDEGAVQVLRHVLRAGTYLAVFWGAFRAVDVAFAAFSVATFTRANPGLGGLLPLGRKIAKLVLLALGLISVLNELGFQVASLIAGLGIGGIALALAAQKTVENLFGSVSIGVDQPFREGDFVKVEDVLGNVEAIGMRSTRIRTPDRTLVTIPNGRLAELRVESFTARDRFRIFLVLGLEYRTTSAQLREVLAGLEAALRGHPRIWPEAVIVRFVGFGESALDVEVVAWLQYADWNEFTAARQELLLEFMAVVERAGTGFAFPTRTVHLVGTAGEAQAAK
jgi:MscS family membrane protein